MDMVEVGGTKGGLSQGHQVDQADGWCNCLDKQVHPQSPEGRSSSDEP